MGPVAFIGKLLGTLGDGVEFAENSIKHAKRNQALAHKTELQESMKTFDQAISVEDYNTLLKSTAAKLEAISELENQLDKY